MTFWILSVMGNAVMDNTVLSRMQRLGRGLGWLGLAGVVMVNGIAFAQARAMTHYVVGAQRTAAPEQLSAWGKAKVLVTGVQLPRPENGRTPEMLGLDYTTHLIEIGSAERLEAWHIPGAQASVQASVQASAPTVREKPALALLFHPYGGSKASLLPVADAFHRLGYGVVMVDFRGSGGSTGDRVTIGIEEAKDVAATSAYVAQQWPDQPQILYGASMGAAAVMRAVAQEGVEPAAVILESPFKSLKSTIGHRFEGMGLPASPGRELLLLWGSVHIGANGFAHRPVDYAQAMDLPVLLFHGAADQRVRVEEAEAIAANLPNLHQFSLLSGSGHGGLVSSDPSWYEHLTAFLDARAFSHPAQARNSAMQ